MARHIPAVSTREMAVLPFDEALRAALAPSADYDAARWLYVPNTYGEYRYILGTRGERPLICVGVNPSTAGPDHLDPTLQSVRRIAGSNGYDSFLMGNVSAQRATRPDDLDRVPDLRLQRENLRAFAYLLSLAGEAPVVWAAWGAVAEKRPYLRDFIREMGETAAAFGARWCCAGARSRRGHPHHPLYLPAASVLEPFDLEAYLAAWP